MQLPRPSADDLSCYSLVMAFKDLRNLSLIGYDDGLIDDGEFIVLYDLDYSILEVFSSSRSFCFCFEVKSAYRSRTALKRISVFLQCSTIFFLSQGSLKPHHVPLLEAKNNMGNYKILVRKNEHLSYSTTHSARVNIDRKGTNSF